ncbi:efflux RND transporter periplasmic adaptor subunit [Aquimarina sp. W85]|uniref:efflux RND transporter periplasmic adaptor subunit n=1 Tax=Aquimarina rhodophyticola TaxID=3342246 RepID=UPI00366AC052
MRKIILTVLGIVLIIVAFFGAQSIINSKKRPAAKPTKVVKTIFVDTVQNSTIPIMISANGNLTAKQRLELFAEVQGVFRGGSHLFRTGQKYKKGQTLIRIDAAEYYASVQSSKSNLYNLITSIMPDLRLDYPEVYPKWQQYLSAFDLSKSTPALPEISSEKENYFISGRNILTSYYNVKNLEQRLSKYRIVAPFQGVLTEALVTEGTLIRQGQKLGTYIETGVYEMEVAIPKAYGNLIELGKSVTLTDLDQDKDYTGTVSRINASVNQTSQTITAYIELKDANLREGMYLEAQLEAKNESNAIQIDRNLLQEGNKIFIVKDSILDLIDVQPTYFGEQKVVLKGVPDQTVILAKSVPGAYAGMLVAIYKETTNASAERINTNDVQ